MKRRMNWMAVALTLVAAWQTLPRQSLACPFCSAVKNTVSEDFAAMDAVVIARLLDSPSLSNAAGQQSGGAGSEAVFAVDAVLKGTDLLKVGNEISVDFFGDARKGDHFLVMGSDPQDFNWSPPVKLDQRRRDYMLELTRLPDEGAERLAFFQDYLQDPDPMLSDDAYNEFARAPYDEVKELEPQMNDDALVAWIQDPEVPASRRRLYFTMLGVCGDETDLPLLEARLRSDSPQAKSGLDALIACYLTLRGPAGVEVVEDLYLKSDEGDSKRNYADVYAAIMALRFHGTQQDEVPRERVLKAFRHLLDNPQMADLVIPDLARWEDWSQLGRLVKLFKEADTKSSWVRMPIINYVRACPLPESDRALEEFRDIDPESVKRAMTFFPTLSGSDEASGAEAATGGGDDSKVSGGQGNGS